MNSQQIANISEKILMKFAETGSMRAAYDAVMGRGEYDKMAGKMYDELRKCVAGNALPCNHGDADMKDKVIALLIKRGHNEASAVAAVEKNLDWAMKAYPEVKASFLANVCASV